VSRTPFDLQGRVVGGVDNLRCHHRVVAGWPAGRDQELLTAGVEPHPPRQDSQDVGTEQGDIVGALRLGGGTPVAPKAETGDQGKIDRLVEQGRDRLLPGNQVATDPFKDGDRALAEAIDKGTRFANGGSGSAPQDYGHQEEGQQAVSRRMAHLQPSLALFTPGEPLVSRAGVEPELPHQHGAQPFVRRARRRAREALLAWPDKV
jgi:hypothetical protein